MALCISAFGGGLFFAWSQMRPEKGLRDPVLYGNFGGHMGSERPKRRGGVAQAAEFSINVILALKQCYHTPLAKIENGTPCSDQFSGPAPGRLGSSSRSRHRPGIRAAETAAKPAPCRGSGPVTACGGLKRTYMGGRESHCGGTQIPPKSHYEAGVG